MPAPVQRDDADHNDGMDAADREWAGLGDDDDDNDNGDGDDYDASKGTAEAENAEISGITASGEAALPFEDDE